MRDTMLRAYELGRLRTSVMRAAFVIAPVCVLAAVVGGARSLAWIPLTALVWIFAHWRGGPILRGSYIGLVGGLITLALPLTILRPCCSPEAMAAGMSCCTQPSACLTAGAALGIALAAFLPTGSSRWHVAGGMVLGVASVAVLRCATLFAAEAFGLAGGLALGVMIATVGRSLLKPRAT